MKKKYIVPTLELIAIQPQQMLALSLQQDEITKDNEQDYEQYSNAFSGGIIDDGDDN